MTLPPLPDGIPDSDFGDFVSTENDRLDLEVILENWHKYDIKETPMFSTPFISEKSSMSDI